MDRIIAKLKSEPIRIRLYGLAVLVLGYLMSKGYIAPEDHEFLLAVAGIILVTESSRSKVSPTVLLK